MSNEEKYEIVEKTEEIVENDEEISEEDKKAEAKFAKFTEVPVHKLVPTLAIPSIITMLVTSIYNIADTYFVSQLSQSASGAVGIIFSLMTIIQTLGFTVSMGCSILMSNELGNKHFKYASQILSTGFFSMAIVGCVIMGLGFAFLDPLIMFLGSTETILPYARTYARCILVGAPFMMTSYVMNTTLRSQGNALLSMTGLASGSLLNIFLNPLLMFGFNLGIFGAGLATLIGQILSFTILFCQCKYNKRALSIEIKDFKPSFSLYGRILKCGMSNFFRQGLGSVASITLNNFANPYGDPAIAAISIVSRIMMFITSAFTGYGQAFQTVAGYNYGAKRYDRVLQAFWFTIKSGLVCVSVFAVIGTVFSTEIISLFRKGDMEVIEIASFMLRLQCMTLPLQAITTISNMGSQCIGYSYRATILASARQGIFFFPTLFIGTAFFGLRGIQVTQAISDVCASIFCVIVMSTILKEVDEKRKAELEKVKL
ncbi:MAG: MATE family efflux transporter [Clostridia bacterium]